ncbi:MAG: ATP phosphoribosyltransferase regulatory subunit [Dehalococcoidia bacterium]
MSSRNQNPNLSNAILPGMAEASPELHHAKLNLTANISEILTNHSYEIFDCPIMEATELYAMKSGGELTSRLYSFVEPGGMDVSLRPEFTSSVIRSYISDEMTESQIVKKQYVGPVFRYSDSSQGSNQRQFTQQGCELIGDSSADADVEILKLSLLTLEKSGLERATVKLGHMGYLRSLLEKFDLSEVLIGFTLSNLKFLTQKTNGIEELSKLASDIGLINPGNKISEPTQTGPTELSKSDNYGRRSIDQINFRLKSKKNNSFSVNKYTESLESLSELLGTFAGDINTISDSHNDSTFGKASQYFKLVVEKAMRDINIEVNFIVDCAAQRGFTYYTGIIFDIEYKEGTDSIPLGGGGRYDGLVKLLGGPTEVPATGFAVNIDSILSINSMDEKK